MRKLFLITIILVSSASIFLACTKDNSNTAAKNLDCSTAPKSFANDINPIIQANCNIPDCHASGSVNGPGPLTNFNQVYNSRIAIRSAVGAGYMPLNRNLSTSQRNTILCWIDSGASNN